MPAVVAVKVVRPYILEAIFDDGVQRQVDVEPLPYGEVFQPLRGPALFAQVSADPVLGTVVWPNGADPSPEFLYEPERQAVEG